MQNKMAVADVEDMPLHLSDECPFRSEQPSCKDCEIGEACWQSIRDNKTLDAEIENLCTEPAPLPESDVSDANFDRLVEFAKNPDKSKFEPEEVIDSVQILRHRVSSRMYMGRGSVSLPCPAKKAFEMFWNLEIRRNWDRFFDLMEVVEKMPSGDELVYMGIKTPPLIANRDFVQLRARRELSKGEYAAVFLPADNDVVPGKKGFVRGTVHFSGIYCVDEEPESEDSPPSCQFVMVSETDFGLPIPDFIVRAIIRKAIPLYFNSFLKAVKTMKTGD